MTDDEYDSQLNALFMKNEAEWLATRIADLCENYDSTDRTLAGIADAEERALCERSIKRTQRDHARYLREHFAKQAIHKARKNAREHEARMRERLKSHDQPQQDVAKRPFSTLPAREIMKRFNTRKTTG